MSKEKRMTKGGKERERKNGRYDKKNNFKRAGHEKKLNLQKKKCCKRRLV
jgi:hypothetical protein